MKLYYMRKQQAHVSFLYGELCMPTKSPKRPDPEHLRLKLLFIEASAIGRFPIACVFLLAMAVLIGLARGWW